MLPVFAFGLLTQLLASPLADLQEDPKPHPWRYAVGSAPMTAPAQGATPAGTSAAEKSTKAAAKAVLPAATQRFSIQLASLSNEEAAVQRKQELESVLGNASVSIVPSAGAWKLRHGAFADRKEALKVREEIKKKALDGFVVEPGSSFFELAPLTTRGSCRILSPTNDGVFV